jgi:hypothetical protein
MPGFFKDKTKLLIVSKKIENGPEQKRLNLNFLELIENVLFRSRILFQKRIYSIFFGTKAGKRKLSILKERWFDIASSVLTLVLTKLRITLVLPKFHVNPTANQI